MGNFWNKDDKRKKVLIFSFDKDYLQQLSGALSIEKLYIDENKGFTKKKLIYKNLPFDAWFILTRNKDLWLQHFLETNGIIINFAFTNIGNDNKLVIDILNTIINQKSLKNIPILFLFDANNKDEEIVDCLRKSIDNKIEKEKYKLLKFYTVDFQNNINDIQIGLDWLFTNKEFL